jgi:hypothetical protein
MGRGLKHDEQDKAENLLVASYQIYNHTYEVRSHPAVGLE